MAATKLLNLIAITALALLATSFGPTPVNAISSRAQHLNRHVAHDAIAKRKRGTTKRCKPRPSSSVASSSHAAATPAAEAASSPAASSTPKSSSVKASSSSAKPAATPASTTPSVGKGGGKVGLAWANGNDASLKNFATDNVIALVLFSSFILTSS